MKFKKKIKLRLMSIFLITVSFISVTLAWFAYSGIANLSTEVNVRAWNIELEKDGKKESNEITVTVDEIYPGMKTRTEAIKIKNLGDSDAEVAYSIVSARILDDPEDLYNVDGTLLTSISAEDSLAHKYPFKINMSLTKGYALAGDESIFEVSISWPLDSNNDINDSIWGTKAYNYHESNQESGSSIQIVISLSASQYLNIDSASDPLYNLGKEVSIDVVTKKECFPLSLTCLSAYIIDVNNTLGDDTVTLLLNPYGSYLSGSHDSYPDLLENLTDGWNVNYRPLKITDVVKIISTDVKNSILIRENLSPSIIGTLKTDYRITEELKKVTEGSGKYQFANNRFGFLSSASCIWINEAFSDTTAYALKKVDEEYSVIWGNQKGLPCKVIPVIEVSKEDFKRP